MTMITSEMRKAQVPSLPSVDSYLVVTRFLCIFTSASFRIEILVFRIRICDVTLKFKLKVSFGILWKIMVALLTIKWLIRVEKVN